MTLQTSTITCTKTNPVYSDHGTLTAVVTGTPDKAPFNFSSENCSTTEYIQTSTSTSTSTATTTLQYSAILTSGEILETTFLFIISLFIFVIGFYLITKRPKIRIKSDN